MSTHTGTIPEGPVSTESSLSNWAGDYVTDILGKGKALSEQDYVGYQGPLTAGATDLQNSAFSGIAGLTLPEGYDTATDQAQGAYANANALGQYNAGTNMWNNQAASEYMNPYVQQALNPQLEEMQRQSMIQRMSDNDALTKAGAYGGGRQAIMNSEQNDNSARLMSELVGKGYQNAYNSAGDMFNKDQDRYEQSRQFGADLGLQGNKQAMDATRLLGDLTKTQLDSQRDIYGDQLDAGGIERGIASEGVAANLDQYQEERDFPYQQLKYAMGLLDGMPLTAQNTNYAQNGTFADIMQGGAGGADMLQTLIDMFK